MKNSQGKIDMNSPDTPIPFTQKHEDVLFGNTHEIKENSREIKENRRLIIENARGIKKNGTDIHRLGLLMEDNQTTLQKVLEVVTYTNERFQIQDDHELKLEHHENRISAIESHLKSRI